MTRIASLQARPLDAAMSEPFEIAGGSTAAVRNVLVKLDLEDGTAGYGEAAPFSAFNGETQAGALKAILSQRRFLMGRDASGWREILEKLDERLESGAARAALSMALLDAWTRRARMPLRALFGGAEKTVRSDITVALVPAERAKDAARRIAARGVRTIKIKVGKDVDEDLERVLAVYAAARRPRLILDANQGYGPRGSIRLLRRLRSRGIVPALFEQPAAKDDWKGLADVHRFGMVPVAADESVCSRAEASRMATVRAAQVVNIKLMKCGILEAWDIALICKAAGLGLMVGGMVESSLAMTAAAHFAAGLGGFSFVDLDTPLWFAKDPMRGVSFGRGGVYDLSKVKAGIGVMPRRAPR